MDNTQLYRRTFLMIPVPESIRAATAGIFHRLHHEEGYDQLNWVKPSLQHITIQFLGNVPGGTLIALAEELRPKLACCQPFNLDIGPIRLFPNLRKAHCLILRVDLNEGLQQLVQTVRETVESKNIDADTKPFRPHITLARIPPKIRRLRRPELVVPPSQFSVDRIILMNSFQEDNGVQYETINQFKLGQQAGIQTGYYMDEDEEVDMEALAECEF